MVSEPPGGRKTAAPAASATSLKIDGLEGLRGILALSVGLGHLGLYKSLGKGHVIFWFQYAVDVFFVLSGFVLAQSNFFRSNVSCRAYVVKRFARLYPLHLLTLALFIGLTVHATGTVVEPVVLLQNLTLTQNVGLPPNRWAYNFPSWSISVEWWCALSFFGLARLVKPARRLGWVLLGLAAGVSVLPLHLMNADPVSNLAGVANCGLIRGIGGFSVGVLTYLACQTALGVSILRRRWLVLAGALTLGALFVLGAGPSTAPFYLASFLVIGGISVATRGVAVLESRPFVWLGTRSYSVYLLHMPILVAFDAFVGAATQGRGKVVVIAAILSAAHVCYARFELPAQRWIRRRLLGTAPDRRGSAKGLGAQGPAGAG
jgi:peptidoglycan/LPS O-acetylase OafA/YrhL